MIKTKRGELAKRKKRQKKKKKVNTWNKIGKGSNNSI